jgi:Mrp family chromosome partitioning ATPase
VVKRFLLATLLGFVVGGVVLVLRFVLVPLIHDPSELEGIGFKVIGQLPWYKQNQSGLIAAGKALPLVLRDEPNSLEANAIRYARFQLEKVLNLEKTRREPGLAKVVSVLSANPHEGKSFTTANMAYALSLSGFRVLAMDLDFMQPNLFTYFGDQAELDEHAIINEDSRVQFQLWKVTPKLDVIDAPRIKENVCDFLESDLFLRFLNVLREDYDIILFDTPPVEGHLEPILATQYADAGLIVVNQRATMIDDLNQAKLMLREGANGPLVAMLNFVYDDIKIVRKFGGRAA